MIISRCNQMKIYIKNNCPQEKIFYFDFLSTTIGLYDVADVVLDATKSKYVYFSLNAPYWVMISSYTNSINDELLTIGLEKYYNEKQILGVCLKDRNNDFLKNSLNRLYPTEVFESLDLNKTFNIDNISMNDVMILREFLQIGIPSPFYIRFPRLGSKITLNEEGKLLYQNRLFDLNIDNLNQITNHCLQEKIKNCSNVSFDFTEQKPTPIYFDKSIYLFNDVISAEKIIAYKNNYIKFLQKIHSKEKSKKYLSTNKNALLLLELINENKSAFDLFVSNPKKGG